MVLYGGKDKEYSHKVNGKSCGNIIIIIIYEFLSRIASSVLKVNCYQRGSCVGGPSAFNSPFGHGSRSHNIRPLDNHLYSLSFPPYNTVMHCDIFSIDIVYCRAYLMKFPIFTFLVHGSQSS